MHPFLGMRRRLADLLWRMYRAVKPPVEHGPPMGSWREQWDRVKLGLDRIEAIYVGRKEPHGTRGAEYDVYTFFIHCHHLADWVATDPALKKTARKKARQLVGKSSDLRICADLANRSKHSTLTRARTDDLSTGPSGIDATVRMGEPGPAHAFRVSSGGQERDARDLAQSCVATWQQFFDLRHLT